MPVSSGCGARRSAVPPRAEPVTEAEQNPVLAVSAILSHPGRRKRLIYFVNNLVNAFSRTTLAVRRDLTLKSSESLDV